MRCRLSPTTACKAARNFLISRWSRARCAEISRVWIGAAPITSIRRRPYRRLTAFGQPIRRGPADKRGLSCFAAVCAQLPWQLVFWCWADRALEKLKMKLLTKAVAGAAIGVGVLAVSAVTASAAIVCSGNVCWHTHERYEYPASAGVVVHEDDWKWGPSEKYTFREHEGRGYWRGDTWTTW